MRTSSTRVIVAVTGGAVLSTLAVTVAGVSDAATRVPRTGQLAASEASHGAAPHAAAPHRAAMPGALLWVKRYNGPGNGRDGARSVAVSPGGRRVFVTGGSAGASSGEDYATIAYNAATGTRLWVKRYNGPGNGDDFAHSVALSPGGSRVFVTGFSLGATSGIDYATIAYNAATGTRLWVKRYNGPGNGDDFAYSVALSPGGSRVFVTGFSLGATSGIDYATIAYNAATGTRLWVKRYNGPGNGDDFANSVAVSRDGKTVFVTGDSTGATSGPDYATIAYNAATGTRLWVKRYNGPGNGEDVAQSVKVSPTRGMVFVTGYSTGATSGPDYATIAYNAASGARLWLRRYNGPGNSVDEANSLAVSPTGERVFVTGVSRPALLSFDYTTIAYSAATGGRLWVKRYTNKFGLRSVALSVAVSPTGGKVFVTGASKGLTDFDYATIADSAATGARLWLRRYNGPGNGFDAAQSVAVSTDGKTVLITGESTGATSGPDYATIAYNAATGARLWLRRYNGPGDSFDGALSVAVSPRGNRVFVTGESTGATSGPDYATIAYAR